MTRESADDNDRGRCGEGEEVFYCTRHNKYVQMKEIIYNNSNYCNFIVQDLPGLSFDLSVPSKL